MRIFLKKTTALLLAMIMILGAAPLSGLVGLELPAWMDGSSVFETTASAASTTNVAWNASYSGVNGNLDEVDLPDANTTYYYQETPWMNIHVGRLVYLHDAYLYLYKDGALYETIHWKDEFPNTNYFRYWAVPLNYAEVGSYYFYFVLTYSTNSVSNTQYSYTSNNYSFNVIDRTPTINLSTSSVSLNLAGSNSATVLVNKSCDLSYDCYWKWDKNSSAITCTWGEWTEDNKLPLTITGYEVGSSIPVTISLNRKSDDAVIASRTIYVTVTKPDYTIKYNANGGSPTPASQTKPYGEAISLTTTIPTRLGYTFLGWSTSSSATSATYLPGGNYSINSNATLYAVWKQTTLTSASSVSTPITYGNQVYYYKFKPSTSGTYVIYSTGSVDTKGYLYNSSGTELATDDDSGDGFNFRLEYNLSAGSTYYYAVRYYGSTTTGSIPVKFGPVYTVSYNANGGTGAPASQQKDYGATITLTSQKPQRDGYTFLGWSTTSSSTVAQYSAGGSYSADENRTLYAVWTKNTYTLTYNGNGFSSYDSSVSGDSTYTIKTNLPDRKGYTFLGWSTSSSATSAEFIPGERVILSANSTLYAVWKQTTLSSESSVDTPITYGGQVYYYKFTPSTSGTYVIYSTGSVDTKGYLYNSSGTELDSDDDGGDSTNFRLSYYLNAGSTYYYAVKFYNTSSTGIIPVKFGPVYTISYNANGGSGAPLSQSKDYGTSIILSDAEPQKDGYTFLGWSTNSTATTAAYSSGSNYSSEGNRTLYAVWRDTGSPTGALSSTNNVAPSQTVTLTLRDNSAVAGYYWGTNPSYADNTYTSLSSSSANTSATKTVSSPGTYYLVVRDNSGNVSIPYAITFHKTAFNAAGGNVSPAYVLTRSGASFALPTPSLSGYSFEGWNSSAGGNGTDYSGVYTATSSMNLYAQWRDTTNPTGSLSTTNNVASSQTVTLNLSDNAAVAGYYWGTSSSYSNNTYTALETATPSTSVTKTVSSEGKYYLFVRDTAGNVSEPYSITFCSTTFNAKGGLINPPYVLTKSGNSFTLPKPEYSGYAFVCWSTDSDGSGSTYTSSYTASSSKTLYAQWRDVTKPTGVISTTNLLTSSQTVTLTLKDNDAVAGYYWGTSSTYTNNSYVSFSHTPEKVATVTVSSAGTYYLTVKDAYGNVSATSGITFFKTTLNANGGSVSPSSVLTKSGESFSLPVPSKSGYSFKGWSDGSSSNLFGVYNVSSSKTLYAQWEDNSNPTGSLSSTNNVASSQTVTLSMSDSVGLAGYYWGTSTTYSDNAYTSIPSSPTSMDVTKTVSSAGTYYLVVKDTAGNLSLSAGITFCKTTLNANGGSVSPSSVLTVSGNSFTLPTPSNGAYVFGNWNTSADGKGSLFAGTYTVSESRTLYAIWEDDSKPSGAISTTNNVASSQTVTLTLRDNAGVDGYYWGTNANYLNNSYTKLSSTSTNTSATKTVSDEGTYYFVVKDNSGNVSSAYTITFFKTTLNANGGSVDPVYVLTKSDNSFNLPVPTNGYLDFNGWNTSPDGSGTAYSKLYTVSSSKTLYARWLDTLTPMGSIRSTNNLSSSQTVTLSLDDNAGVAGYYWGTSPTYSDNTYTALSSVTASTSVTKSVSSAGTYYLVVKDIAGNVSSSERITFYRTILDARGGSVNPSSVLTMSGNSFTPPTPTYGGSDFVSWNSSPNGSGIDYIKSYLPISSATLYAQWQDTAKPTGSLSSTNNVASSQTVTLSLQDNAGVAGYYWGTESYYADNVYTELVSVSTDTQVQKQVSKEGTYYLAVVDISENVSSVYSITFCQTTLNANGGSVSPYTVISKSGSSFALPTPMLEGFGFIGWNTAANGNGTNCEGLYTASSSATLHAQWADTAKPAASINSTNELASAQTVTINIRDNVGIEGYYWGKKPVYSENSFERVDPSKTSCNFSNEVSEPGTYYLTVKDTAGNVSQSYEITFCRTTLNPGKGSVDIKTVLTQKGLSFTLPAVTLKNHEYIGWSDDSEAEIAEYINEFEVTSDKVLYAVLISDVLIVSFNANTGEGAPEAIKYDNNVGTTLPKAVPTKSYKVTFNANGGTVNTPSSSVFCLFDSWNTMRDGTGEKYLAGGFYAAAESATLYAQWKNPSIGNLPEPTFTRKNFTGWYTEQVGGEKVTSETQIDSNVTLYAHWSDVDTYTVSYDVNGGTNAPSAQTLYDRESIYLREETPIKNFKITYKTDGGTASSTSKVVKCTFDGWKSTSGNVYSSGDLFSEYADTVLTAQWINPTAGKLATAQKDGSNFMGWYTDDGQLVSDTTVITEDITLNARWSAIATYTVTYDANGGTNAPEPQVKIDGDVLTLTRATPDKSFIISYDANGGACKQGVKEVICVFKNWNDGNGNVYYPADLYSDNSNVTLYADWGTTKAGALEIPEKRGYTFDGWFTEREGGQKIDASSVITSDLTLYAHWTANTYTIKFFDGSTLLQTKNMHYDEIDTLNCTNIPTRNGYSFIGWAEHPGESVKYDNADQIINLTDKNNYTISLYAVWLKCAALEDLSYSFINNYDGFNGKAGFHYGKNYVIGLNVYRNAFGKNTLASELYNNDVNVLGNLWGGNCYGMSSTALMFNSTSSSGMATYDFNDNALLVSDLSVTDVNENLKYIDYSGPLGQNKKERDMTLTEYIEIMQVSQKCKLIQDDYRKNRNDLNGLCELIEDAKSTNKFPIIAVFGLEGGHAVVGYDIRKITDKESRLYIYDCNYPETERYITLKTDSEGNYTEWNYDLSAQIEWGTNHEGSWISYVPYEDFEYVWLNRGNGEKLQNNKVNVLMINSSNYEIRDVAGNLMGKCEEEAFVSYDEEIQQIYVAEMNVNTSGLVMVPTDMYKIVNTDNSDNDFSVTMVNKDLGATVSTTASEITMVVDDQYDLNSIDVNAANGDSYSMELYSSMDNHYNTIALNGIADGTQISLSCGGGDLNITVNNSTDVSLSVDGVSQQLPQKKQIKSIEILNKPDKTDYTYKTGNKIDKAGMSLIVRYTDGSTEIVSDTSKFTCSGLNTSKEGVQEISVEYEGFKTSYNVRVSYAWWQWIIRILLLGFLWY